MNWVNHLHHDPLVAMQKAVNPALHFFLLKEI